MGFVSWVRLQWDRVGAWVCIVAAVVALILGYVGVSGTAYTSEQLPYIVSGGLTGIFLLGLGGMLWLSADLRDEWRKLDDLDRTLMTHSLAAAAPEDSRVDSSDDPSPPTPRGRTAGRRQA
jgi:hypothetical protein